MSVKPPDAMALELPKITRRSSLGEVFRAAFGAAVERLIRNDAKLRASDDIEGLHQSRVAVRKLRSHLRTFEPVLDEHWAGSLRDRLDVIGKRLGEARDADVMSARIRADAEGVNGDPGPILAHLERERKAEHTSIAALLREDRYITLLADVVEAAKRPYLRQTAELSSAKATAAIFNPVWRRLEKAVRTSSRPPTDRDLHKIRIKAKNVRYAAEALEPKAGGKMRRLARAAERLQTLLGDQHDAVVACHLLAGLSLTPQGEFIPDELSALEQRAANDGRRRWKRCWQNVCRANRRRA